MKKMTSIIALVAIFVLAGCGVTAPVSNSDDYSDLSACGDFPLSNDGSGPSTHYFVCRAASDGQCYYKKTSFEQIEGCDPEFDKYDYGKEECFENKSAVYSVEGALLENVGVNSNDACASTTQTYFESKISE